MKTSANIFLIICGITTLYSALSLAESAILDEPISPIPEQHGENADKVKLGQQLFSDVRLSKDNKIACASCHQLEQGGDDGLKTSITNTGMNDLINAPTIFNSRYNFRQTWRGAFRSLELQAEGDIRNPRHGNIGWDELLPKMNAIKEYRQAFGEIGFEKITREAILNVIASYERTLITPNSKFDQYLKGDHQAINDNEKKGYQHFKNYGCIACHQGVNVGGNVFQKFGLFNDYFKKRGSIKKADYGLYNVSGKEKDKFVFRVPSLRNVEVTSPYLHDGTVKKLDEAVRLMAEYQLGATIPDKDIRQIVMFLKTLTGEFEGVSLRKGSGNE